MVKIYNEWNDEIAIIGVSGDTPNNDDRYQTEDTHRNEQND